MREYAIPLIFFRRLTESESVPEWFKDLPAKRTARVLLCFYHGRLVALHGFIEKTRARPDEDLALARRRKNELKQ